MCRKFRFMLTQTAQGKEGKMFMGKLGNSLIATSSKLSVVVLCIFQTLVFGCAQAVSIHYSPSNLLKGRGTVHVEHFEYRAFKNGLVDPDEVEANPFALGSMHLAENIVTLFSNALRSELKFSGYDLSEKTDVVISGVIQKFYYDWVGLNEEFELQVHYHIIRNGSAVYSKAFTSIKSASKSPGNAAENIKSAIHDSIEQFIGDAQSNKML
jgi:hypothetical protein